MLTDLRQLILKVTPRTGETITIAAKRDAGFKPGKELTEKLAQGETTPTPEVAL
jgi:nucleoid DNA-binding protein